jgi:hypothetical protein
MYGILKNAKKRSRRKKKEKKTANEYRERAINQTEEEEKPKSEREENRRGKSSTKGQNKELVAKLRNRHILCLCITCARVNPIRSESLTVLYYLYKHSQ